jgi:RsiW-degrading membrane proteinase PrsW (M82 family)
LVPLTIHSLICFLVSVFPVIVFLIVLIYLDSFKLVRVRQILLAIVLGCVIAFACLWINIGLIDLLRIGTRGYARYIAPVIEEALKSAFLIHLVRRKRIGFMVDAAIYGFAVGAGFAIIENIYYFKQLSDPNLPLWIIRGFGTAVMHGGVTAAMGIVSKNFSERYASERIGVFLPGMVLAMVLHSFFNHFFLSPLISTVGMLIFLPLLVVVVFRSSENATREWLGVRFDTDQELLEMINTGKTSETRVGAYLHSLTSRFSGKIVADMLCLLRLHLELSIRAKGILLMREAGFRVPEDPEVAERFVELKYLEKSIGKTGQLAIAPVFHTSSHDLWQLYMLGKR